MPKRASKLVLKSFRGATTETQFDFDDSKPVTLIYGENGCGKTTIVDGLDFVCNGKMGSLEDRSITTNKWDCLASKASKPSDVHVSIEFDKTTFTARLGKKAADLCSTAGRPVAHILRKTQILRIIDAQPAKRYEAIQALVEIPELESCENSLREAHKQSNKNLEESVRAATQAENTLQTIWHDEGEPNGDFLTWAENLTKSDVASKRTQVKQIDDILTPFQDCQREVNSLSENAKTAEERAKENETDIASLRKAETTVSAEGATLVKLLQEATAFLTKSPQADSCPVCESEIDRDQLLKKLAERMKQLEQITLLVKQKEESAKKLSNAQAILEDTRRKLVASAEKLYAAVSGSALPEISSLKLNSNDYKLLSKTEREPSVTNQDICEVAKSLISSVLEATAKLASNKTILTKSIDQFNAVNANLNALKEKKSSAASLTNTVKSLKDMLAIFEQHRKEHVNQRLETISDTVEELFQELHPGEELGKAKFYLNANKKGSLEFHGQFLDDEEAQLQAYYSDSHLDTLGICVFLALAECYGHDNMVIVLDDVISSVDQLHTDRFMEVMHKYATKFKQLIMTTHFRPLKDRYLYARGPAANVQIIELLPWTKQRGIVHTKTKVKAERLEELLKVSPLDRESAASQAGILLESLLDFITLQYQCKMPRSSDPSYTLARLIQGIEKKLAEALKTTQSNGTATVTELKAILDSISGLNWIRNQVGCHFSLKGMSITDREVQEFAELTVKLSKALICTHCGELPRKSKSGSDWECTCGKMHLAPLVIPGMSPSVG